MTTNRPPVASRFGVYLTLPSAKVENTLILWPMHCRMLELAKSVLVREDWEHYAARYSEAAGGLPALSYDDVSTSDLPLIRLSRVLGLKYEHLTHSNRRFIVSYLKGSDIGCSDEDEDDDDGDDADESDSSRRIKSFSDDLGSPLHILNRLASALTAKGVAVTAEELANIDLNSALPRPDHGGRRMAHREESINCEYLFLGGALDSGNVSGLSPTQRGLCHQITDLILHDSTLSAFDLVNDVSAVDVAPALAAVVQDEIGFDEK